MTPPPFTFRLVSFDGNTTEWIAYRHIEFRGRLMRITLVASRRFKYHRGDELRFETAVVNAHVTFDRVLGETLFLILPEGSWPLADSLKIHDRNGTEGV